MDSNAGMERILNEKEAAMWVFRGALADQTLSHWQSRVAWRQQSIRMFGKTHAEPRLTAWFGPAYRYSNVEWPATAFPEAVQELMNEVEATVRGVDERLPVGFFNAVLLNLYRDGRDHMGWHRDNEPEIDGRWIASLSLGAGRDFVVRDRADRSRKWTVALGHGDLLVMRNLQEDFEHALPKRLRVEGPRLNFTFRRCGGG